MKNSNRNVLALAYIGDGIYEVFVREYLVRQGIEKVNELQKLAVNYVSARSQASFLKEMIDTNMFNEEELSIILRARNHKGSSHPKNTDIITYKYATGLEALIGALYLDNNKTRIDEIMNYILNK